MQISVRSYLTLGTAAVVGAGAVALAPLPAVAAGPAAVPAPAVIDVALTGLNLPITQIIGVLQNFGIGGPLTQILNLVPGNLIDGVGNEFLTNAGGLVLTAATDLFGFASTVIAGLLTGPGSILPTFGAMLGSVPSLLSNAVQSIVKGDFAGAVQSVTDALAAPITKLAQAVAAAGAAIGDFVVQRFGTLGDSLPNVLLTAVQSVLGGGVQAVFDTVKKVIAGVSGLFGIALPFASTGSVAAPAAAALTAARITDVAPQPVAEIPAAASVASSPVATPRANRAAGRAAVTVAPPAANSVAASGAEEAATEAPAPVTTVTRQGDKPESVGSADAGSASHSKSAHARAKRAG